MNTLLCRSMALASLLLGSSSLAAALSMDQFSLNYEEIKVTYAPDPDTVLPFGLEVTVDAEGHATTVFRPIRVHNVTLKRGIIASEQSPAFTELAFALDGGTADATIRGDLSFLVPHDETGNGTRAAIEKTGTGTLVLSGGSTHAQGIFQVRFQGQAGVVLQGEPARWFHVDRQDGALVATIAVPSPGKILKTSLRITDGVSAASLPLVVRRTADTATR